MPDEWVPATPATLWFKRKVRIKSWRLEGVIVGPPTAVHGDYPVNSFGAVRYIPVWDLEVRKGRN